MKDNSGTSGIDLLGEEEADFVRTIADGIEHHPKTRLRPCLKELKAHGGCQGAVKRINQSQCYSFDEEVSVRSSGRIAAILETLARALEEVGGALENARTVKLFGETVHLAIYEKTKKEPHSITPEEKREQQKYEHYGWGKPNIRTWDYRFDGLLKIKVASEGSFNSRSHFAQSERTTYTEKQDSRLEEMIPDIFLAICDVCARKRAERLEMVERVSQHEEAVRYMQAEIDRFNLEVKKLERAIEEARRFESANLLRRYANAIAEEDSSEAAEYAEWLGKKADWFDPAISVEDPIFGLLSDTGIPQCKPNCSTSLPYELEWFFKRRGSSPNSTWEAFLSILNKA